jgi:hypothetical protein
LRGTYPPSPLWRKPCLPLKNLKSDWYLALCVDVTLYFYQNNYQEWGEEFNSTLSPKTKMCLVFFP